MIREQEYAQLLACYRSGQIPEAAWQEHLKDEAFAAWVRQHLPAGVDS